MKKEYRLMDCRTNEYLNTWENTFTTWSESKDDADLFPSYDVAMDMVAALGRRGYDGITVVETFKMAPGENFPGHPMFR